MKYRLSRRTIILIIIILAVCAAIWYWGELKFEKYETAVPITLGQISLTV